MKIAWASFLLLLAACTSTVHVTSPTPPVPRTMRLTAKAASAPATTLRAPLAAAPQPTGALTFTNAFVISTDGTNVLDARSYPVVKVSMPNPTLGSFTFSTSGDMKTWTVVAVGTNLDPVVIYDFSFSNPKRYFYRFVVDAQ